MASRCRNFEGGGPKETAKEEENKKNKDPEAQKTDEIEQKYLQKPRRRQKQFKSCDSHIRPIFIM